VPDEAVRSQFRGTIQHRAKGVPVAQLIGEKEFFSLALKVTSDVLVPRPETEDLVVRLIDLAREIVPPPRKQEIEAIRTAKMTDAKVATETLAKLQELAKAEATITEQELDVVQQQVATLTQRAENASGVASSSPQQSLTLLDVGTGSGAIAIAAAKNLPHATVVAVDVSPQALAVASENVRQHQLTEQIQLFESDLFAGIPEGYVGKFDIIASNPPYIANGDPDVAPEVKEHEPHIALYAGDDGTEIIARLLQEAPRWIVPCGSLLIEIGPNILQRVQQLVAESDAWQLVKVHHDLARLPRFVELQKTNEQTA